MIAPKNHFIVKVPSLWEEHYVTESGFKLLRETHQHEDRYRNAKTSGVIACIPRGFSSNEPLKLDTKDSRKWTHLNLEGTFPVEVGDTVHFSVAAMMGAEDDRSTVVKEESDEDGKRWMWIRVLADDVFAVERESGLQALGGKVCIEPLEEATAENLSSILYMPETVKKKRLKNAGVLISKSRPMQNGYGIEAEAGDVVFYKRSQAEYCDVNGKNYEFTYLEDVSAFVTGEAAAAIIQKCS